MINKVQLMNKLAFILISICALLSMPGAFCIPDSERKESGKNIPEEAFIHVPGEASSHAEGFSPGDNATLSYISKAFYFNVVPSASYIFNKDIYHSENWQIKNGVKINVEFGYFGKFSRIIGYGFGLGYSSFSTEISSDPVISISAGYTDIDGDDYIQLLKTTSMVEKTKVSYVDIPMFIEFSNITIDKIGFYGRAGLTVSFPLTKSFTSSGNASYGGYYDQYNVVLYGIPELGFDSNKPIYSETEMSLNLVNISAIFSGGITYPLSKYFIIRGGLNANVGLVEMSKVKAENYEKTKFDGNYSKLLENPNSTTLTRSFGIEVGLIYTLRLY